MPGLRCFETGEKLHHMGVHTGPAVLTNMGPDRMTNVPLMNMTDRDIMIQTGAALGMVSHADEDTAGIRVAEFTPTTAPQTRSKKKEEYIL